MMCAGRSASTTFATFAHHCASHCPAKALEADVADVEMAMGWTEHGGCISIRCCHHHHSNNSFLAGAGQKAMGT